MKEIYRVVNRHIDAGPTAHMVVETSPSRAIDVAHRHGIAYPWGRPVAMRHVSGTIDADKAVKRRGQIWYENESRELLSLSRDAEEVAAFLAS